MIFRLDPAGPDRLPIFDPMPKRAQTVLFFLSLLFLSSWHLDQSSNANTVSRAATVAAIVEQGTFRIDRFAHLTGDKALVKGHYYSEKAPLPALLVVPFHWLLNASGAIADSTPDHLNLDLLRLGGFVCGSLPFALVVLLCWKRLQRSLTFIEPALLVLLTFFGSFLFVYSGSFYGHLPGALFLLLAFIAMEDHRFTWTGIWAGCAVLCEYALLIFPLCWLIGMLWKALRSEPYHWQPILRTITGALPFVAGLFSYDQFLFGHPLSLGYDHVANYVPSNGSVVGAISLDAAWNLTFGMYRGLFPHMPILLLCLVALAFSQRQRSLTDAFHVFAPAVLSVLFVASIGMWWGGWAFGPRHLTGVAVLLAYHTLPQLAEQRWVRYPTLVLGVLGTCYTLATKSTLWYALPTGERSPIAVILPALNDGNWTSMQWPVLLGAPPWLATLFFVLIFAIVGLAFTVRERQSASADAPLPLP